MSVEVVGVVEMANVMCDVKRESLMGLMLEMASHLSLKINLLKSSFFQANNIYPIRLL
jgi:hypothetical protein